MAWQGVRELGVAQKPSTVSGDSVRGRGRCVWYNKSLLFVLGIAYGQGGEASSG